MSVLEALDREIAELEMQLATRKRIRRELIGTSGSVGLDGAPLQRRPATDLILDAMQVRGGAVTAREIQNDTGLPQSSVFNSLRALRKRGIVEAHNTGQRAMKYEMVTHTPGKAEERRPDTASH